MWNFWKDERQPKKPKEYKERTVVKEVLCIASHQCRVLLDNGTRGTVNGPTAIGDNVYRYYGRGCWEVEENIKFSE